MGAETAEGVATAATRPLDGVKVVDVSALGPGPFTSMVLASHGADVVRVERPGGTGVDTEYFHHGKRGVHVDLKSSEGRDAVRRLVAGADVFLEGYRPGVMERLGLGPDELLADNPGLIYVRLTGWGNQGPLAAEAGHDIDYLAVAGALSALGGDTPEPPLALLGDFAGGGLFAVVGILLALHQRSRTGRGQVVDAAIVDGVTTLLWSTVARAQRGDHGPRQTNLTDGGRPYYRTYRCADGKFFAVGAIEPRFYAKLLAVLELTGEDVVDQEDATRWPALVERMTAVFATRTRDEWAELFAGSEACGAPVLDVDEAGEHPHLRARMYVGSNKGGTTRIRPAPRLSGAADSPVDETERNDPRSIMLDYGMSAEDVDDALDSGAVSGMEP